MSPIIPLFATTFLFPLVLLGWGAALSHLTLPKEQRATVTAWQLVMLGFPVIAVLGYLLNLVTPIYDWISDLTWLIGFALAYVFGRESLVRFWNQKQLRNIALLLMLVLTLLSRVEAHSYDTGYYMYHFRWMKEVRMFIGIANMNIGMGVNSMWFSICALTWNSLTGLAGAFGINAILVFMFLMVLIELFPFQKLLENKSLGLFELFVSILLIYFLLPTDMGWGRKLIFDTLGSPETTGPATLYAILAGLWFMSSFWTKEPKLKMGLFISVTSVFVLATKMTHALFAFVPLIWLAFEYKNITIKKLLPMVTFSLVMLSVFMVRSFAMSGCVAFPSMCSQNVSWSVNPAAAAYYAMEGRAYAIDPDSPPAEVLANWSWLSLWGVRVLRMTLTKTYIYFFLLGSLFYLFHDWFSKNGKLALNRLNVIPRDIEIKTEDHKLSAPEKAILLLCFVGLIAWFLLCPDLRYGYSYFVVGSVVTLVLGLYRSGLHKAFSRYIALLVVIGAATFVLNSRMEKTFKSWIQKPNQAFPIVPTIEIVEGRTRAGDVYYYPKDGNRCWMSPINCVSLKNDNFHLDMSGFYPMATWVPE